jgi:hypothetical protein
MKLILCKQCNDIVRLFSEIRTCRCKKSAGVYLNDLDAVYSGEFCIPLGIDNTSMTKAIHRRDSVLYDNLIHAFVVHDYSETFKRVQNVKTAKKQKS